LRLFFSGALSDSEVVFLTARLRGAFGSSAMYTKSFVCKKMIFLAVSGFEINRTNSLLIRAAIYRALNAG
jgi:hypothetical protein